MGRRFAHLLKDKVRAVAGTTFCSPPAAWAPLFAEPALRSEIVAQMDSLGVQSLSIVVLTGMFTGMVLALQSAASLDVFRRAALRRPPGLRLDGARAGAGAHRASW